MVQGAEALTRKLAAIPKRIETAARAAIEKGVTELVDMMKRQAPTPEVAASIGWTWGDAPKGSFTMLKSSRGKEYSGMRITVYSTHPMAHWFEFGTSERFRKSGGATGKMTADPFFWPSYRALRNRIRSRIRREISKAIKEVK